MEEAYSYKLSKIWSTPPSCEHKCYGCTPSEAIQVQSTRCRPSRVMKGVQHEAYDYLLKPIRMKELAAYLKKYGYMRSKNLKMLPQQRKENM
ncbi:hypothetical protein JHK82_035044 [Glycine max]|nr:hypothetical protein JHK85_035781 [Glycine max]KAG4975673.1 hypothetical protein JHK86_035147 [Glycine max]KAG5111775.1 hypothetical protein JHK82_035044 [Glycine max]KAG5129061.1 hypothetical protein JHK84_035458 [Glycine max]